MTRVQGLKPEQVAAVAAMLLVAAGVVLAVVYAVKTDARRDEYEQTMVAIERARDIEQSEELTPGTCYSWLMNSTGCLLDWEHPLPCDLEIQKACRVLADAKPSAGECEDKEKVPLTRDSCLATLLVGARCRVSLDEQLPCEKKARLVCDRLDSSLNPAAPSGNGP